MSLDFKLHYDRLREGDPTKPEAALATNEEGFFYEEPSHARNLCLVWPDGRRHFLSYAYLVSGTFDPSEDTNEITLNFVTYTVTIKGYCLDSVFIALLDHLPKQIAQTEMRYTTKNTETIAEILLQPVAK